MPTAFVVSIRFYPTFWMETKAVCTSAWSKAALARIKRLLTLRKFPTHCSMASTRDLGRLPLKLWHHDIMLWFGYRRYRSKPDTPGEYQNSWDFWMFISIKILLFIGFIGFYRYWSIAICHPWDSLVPFRARLQGLDRISGVQVAVGLSSQMAVRAVPVSGVTEVPTRRSQARPSSWRSPTVLKIMGTYCSTYWCCFTI